MATTKNSKEVFVVNYHEIPETICVETRFITQAAVNNKPKQCDQLFYIKNKNGNLEMTRQVENLVSTKSTTTLQKPPTTVTLSIQANTLASGQLATTSPIILPATAINKKDHNKYTNTTVATTSQAQQMFSLNTSVLPLIRPSVDQTQQTEVSTLNMKSIAIQCKLDEEMYDAAVEWPVIIDEPSEEDKEEENSEIIIESFLKFVKDNSTQHKTFKECLLCGEVCKSKKYFYGHMAIHQGSRILCSKCGQYLDNEKLLSKHNCRKEKQLEKAFLQCPHHSCSVTAISHLELYDHINEHDNNRMYKCSACRRGFCSGQEFLRHILIRAKCYTSAKRKRFHVYGLESHKERLCRVRVFTLHTFKKRTILVKTFLSQRPVKHGICKICLTSFTNRSVFNRHRIKCLMKFRKRLLRKKYGKTNSIGSC